MPRHSYQAAEKYILSREFFGMKLGLDNITTFLDEIGTPQNNYKTIHISGTNGKGSSAAMLDSILRAAGYKTGLFTSPHLISFRERIKVNGQMIPKTSLISFIDKHRTVLTKRKLSFFELVTAMALNHFAKAKVDIAVIETGLGGRLDATNVLNPIMTITTQISRDHIEILGSSISKIAYEKAGIIKPKTPHLIGYLSKSADKVFEKKCKDQNSRLFKLEDARVSYEYPKLRFTYSDKNFKIQNLSPSLVGTHQLENAALVINAVSILRNKKLRISKKAIIEGLTSTKWPGRFQIETYKDKPTHIIDVSHNVSGTKAFVESFKLKYPRQKAEIITGFVKRKEHQELFNSLSKIAKNYALVPLNTRRSTDINELIEHIDFKKVPYKKFGKLETAYKDVLKKTKKDDIIIVIGSHYLVGEFLNKYK